MEKETNNLKEEYKVLMMNKELASKELANLLARNDEAQENYLSILDKVALAQSELQTAIDERDTAKTEKKNFIAEISKLQELIAQEKERFQITTIDNNSSLFSQQETKRVIGEEMEVLERQRLAREERNNEILERINSNIIVEYEIIERIGAAELEEQNINTRIELLKNKEIRQEIDTRAVIQKLKDGEEAQKQITIDTVRNLEEREKAVRIKEKDLQILGKRN